MTSARALGRVRWDLFWPLSLALAVVGCGGGSTGDADGDVGAEVADDDGGSPGEYAEPSDSTGDAEDVPDLDGADPEADVPGWEGSEYVVVPPTGGICGDGVLDPGEECDDRNRLNGDGCDWLCRLGEGDPAPGPDPGAGDFVPDGEPATLTGTVATHATFERLPLVWTGSEFATGWFDSPEESAGRIRFWRFDRTGRRLDAEWTMPSLRSYGGMEVVWTGAGFGLFYVELESGLWYLRLDREGKPMSEPVLVEADARARLPAADLTTDGAFILAWLHDGSDIPVWSACGPIDVPNEIRIRRVEIDGVTPGAVHRLPAAAGPPDVATGASGFGVVYLQPWEADHRLCALRFVTLDASLGDPRYVGILGEGMAGDVRWIPDRSQWLTAWTYSPDPDVERIAELRVAAIEAGGALAAPPIRNRLIDHDWTNTPVRLAVTPDALAFGYALDGYDLRYLPADRMGVATSLARVIRFEAVRAYGATGTADGFAVLSAESVDDAGPPGLVLRLFRGVP